jgi:hypothetical protein
MVALEHLIKVVKLGDSKRFRTGVPQTPPLHMLICFRILELR